VGKVQIDEYFVSDKEQQASVAEKSLPRFSVGSVFLSAITLAAARDHILNWIRTGQRHYVNVCTADTMVKCYDDPVLAEIVSNAGMATTDGMPLVWLARRHGFKEATRVYGPDLMLEVCAVGGIRHYFYGSTREVLVELERNLKVRFPQIEIVGTFSPPFRPLTDKEKDHVVARINASGANVVWCGLGTPKQDFWVAEFRPLLSAAALIAVGAAFDFHARRIRQAPRWMMRCGLEWLFRLWCEPRRLWRRYLIGNPRFIGVVGRQWWRGIEREK
jgi:N-acetylglucosaminyldiphosphoundecaprenol N-acetyl-beta-D-mannosaminyltransferase